MKFGIYTVYDSQAQAHLPPFFLATDAMAKRAFSDAVNDSSHQFAKHPSDYTLFRIGEYDDFTGVITHQELHDNFGLASVYLSQE